MLLFVKLCSTAPLPLSLIFGVQVAFVIAPIIMPELLVMLIKSTIARAMVSRLLHSLRDDKNHCGEDGKYDGEVKQAIDCAVRWTRAWAESAVFSSREGILHVRKERDTY